MTCCGSCGSKKSESSGMDWGPQGFKIRQDDTFMVPATSEFSGWKTSYGPECGCGGECAGSCGKKAGESSDARFQARADGQFRYGVQSKVIALKDVLMSAHPGWASAGGSGDPSDLARVPISEIDVPDGDRGVIQEVPTLAVGGMEEACAAIEELEFCCTGVACRPVDGFKGWFGAKHCIFIMKKCNGEIVTYSLGIDGLPGKRVGKTEIYKNGVAGVGPPLFKGKGASQKIDRGPAGGGPTTYTTWFIKCSPCIHILCDTIDVCANSANDHTVDKYPFKDEPWNINPLDKIPDNVCTTFACWMARQSGLDIPWGDAPEGGDYVEDWEDYDFDDHALQMVGGWLGY